MPDFEQVLDWLEGGLGPHEAAAVAAAVEADPELARLAAWLRTFLGLAADTSMDVLPDRVHAALSEQFRVHRPAPPRSMRHFVATIRFDTATAARPVGVRAGTVGAGQRHLVLDSEMMDIALDVYSQDGAWVVEGQLLPRGAGQATPAQVRLLGTAGGVAASSFPDESGSFALDVAVAGRYGLHVLWGDVVVEADLELP